MVQNSKNLIDSVWIVVDLGNIKWKMIVHSFIVVPTGWVKWIHQSRVKRIRRTYSGRLMTTLPYDMRCLFSYGLTLIQFSSRSACQFCGNNRVRDCGAWGATGCLLIIHTSYGVQNLTIDFLVKINSLNCIKCITSLNTL